MSESVAPRRLPHLSPGAVGRRLGAEVVVLDPDGRHVHALTGDVAAVWCALEDRVWPELSAARIESALAALRAHGLVGPLGPDASERAEGISRRRLMAVGAGAGLAAAGITSLALPSLAMATSTKSGYSTEGSTPLTITISAGATAYVRMVGGGGGGAYNGSAGGGATTLYVSILNTGASAVTVYGWPGSAGTGGASLIVGGAGGVVAAKAQETYYSGGNGGGAGGGGGAATLLTTGSAPGSAPFVVAAGGGGGGGLTAGGSGTGGSGQTYGANAANGTGQGGGGGGVVGGSAGGLEAGGNDGTSTPTGTSAITGATVTVAASSSGWPQSAVTYDAGASTYGGGGGGGGFLTAGTPGTSGAVYVDIIP